jgi:hypothetical protein
MAQVRWHVGALVESKSIRGKGFGIIVDGPNPNTHRDTYGYELSTGTRMWSVHWFKRPGIVSWWRFKNGSHIFSHTRNQLRMLHRGPAEEKQK